MKALYYLLQKSKLYQMEDIHIDYDWRERLVTQEKMQENINSSEKSDAQNTDHQEDHIQGRSDTDEEVNAPSINTMLDDLHVDNNNMSLTFAPGEGKRPIFHEPLAEYICFPSIFCGQKCPSNNERMYPVQIHELFKYELRSADTRVASNTPNIFWKVKHKQIKQIADKVSLAVCRNKTKGKKITAKMLLDKEQRNNIVKLDEGYYIFRTIRNSPAYFDAKKKDVMAMVRQLGIPTIFYSLSAADTKWVNLLISLAKLIDDKTYLEEDIAKMTWAQKCRLISPHPAACARFFNHRVQKFFKHVLQSPHSPFGTIQYYFYRVEFQHTGSPHIHGLAWIKDTPKFDVDSDGDVCSYVDKIISCSNNVPESDLEFLQLQKHKHSKTCRKKVKGQTVC